MARRCDRLQRSRRRSPPAMILHRYFRACRSGISWARSCPRAPTRDHAGGLRADGDRVTIRPGSSAAPTPGAPARTSPATPPLTAGRGWAGRSRPAGLWFRRCGAAQAPGRLLSTGDEVREPGEPLPWQIHDANRYILAGCSSAWVSRCRITASSRRSGEVGRCAARGARRATWSSPRAASRPARGPCPHAVANNGSLYFWRLAIKPPAGGMARSLNALGGLPAIRSPRS